MQQEEAGKVEQEIVVRCSPIHRCQEMVDPAESFAYVICNPCHD